MKYGIFLPVLLQVLYGKPPEQFLPAAEIRLQRGYEKALAEAARTAEEIIAAVVNQLIQKRGLVYIYIAVVSKLLKILYAYGEFHISYGLLSVSLYLPLLYAACRRREVYTYLIYMTIA